MPVIKKRKKAKRKGPWIVYILQCADNTFYTGITNDLERRVAAHNCGRGAKYITASRRPAVVIYTEKKRTIATAMRRERGIKKISKKQKIALVEKIV